MSTEFEYPETIVNLINSHLRNHEDFEEGMKIDSVKKVNNGFFIRGILNYTPTKLTRDKIQAVYSATVKDFQP
jgi:hypothetical protein